MFRNFKEKYSELSLVQIPGYSQNLFALSELLQPVSLSIAMDLKGTETAYVLTEFRINESIVYSEMACFVCS